MHKVLIKKENDMKKFWQKKYAVAEVAVSVADGELLIPESKIAESRIERSEVLDYIHAAQEVGVDCSGILLREKILRCLRDENIHIFEPSRVVAFLDKKLGPDWEWFGLRDIDAEHLGGWITHTKDQRDVKFSKRVYREAVPLPVLLTVKKVIDQVPEAFFYVSAPQSMNGDPFLAVGHQKTPLYVIERWDEPNFRDR